MKDILVGWKSKFSRKEDNWLYFTAPACPKAEARFFGFLSHQLTNRQPIFPKMIQISEWTKNMLESVDMEALCIQKPTAFGEGTYLCLQGPFSGVLVCDGWKHKTPQRPIYAKPSCHYLSELRNAKYELQQQYADMYLDTLIRMLVQLHLPVEEDIFRENSQLFTQLTAAAYQEYVSEIIKQEGKRVRSWEHK